MESQLQASVVIPTHGRRDSLLRVLRALAQQTTPAGAFEVVLVCDGDVDGSAAASRDLAGELPYSLRVIEQPNQGPAAARNRGVAEARAPLIVFIDDDVVPDERLLEVHRQAQAGQEMRVTIGPLLPPRDFRLNAWGAWEEHNLCRDYAEMEAGRLTATFRQFYTGNASILKRHIVEVGGFDAQIRRSEDVEFGLRLHLRGLHFVFVPQARGWHYVWRSFESWQRIARTYGEADVNLGRTIPEWVGIVQNFRAGHRVTNVVSAAFVGRYALTDLGVCGLGLMARLTYAAGLGRLSHGLCGLLFHVRYFDGVARAVGGRAAALRLMRGEPLTSIMPPIPARQTVAV